MATNPTAPSRHWSPRKSECHRNLHIEVRSTWVLTSWRRRSSERAAHSPSYTIVQVVSITTYIHILEHASRKITEYLIIHQKIRFSHALLKSLRACASSFSNTLGKRFSSLNIIQDKSNHQRNIESLSIFIGVSSLLSVYFSVDIKVFLLLSSTKYVLSIISKNRERDDSP